MTSLGGLVVHLAANIGGFVGDMGKAAHEAARNFDKMQRDAQRMGKVIGAEVAGAVTALATLTKMSINSADATLKLSQAAGVSVESFSAMAYHARLSDVSVQDLSSSISKLNKNIVDASDGTGESARAFQALGINVRNTDGSLKNADRIMEEVANKFAMFKDGAAKSALAIALFGKAGAALIPMLNGGADAMRKSREEAEKLGVVFGQSTAEAAERFNDNLTKLRAVSEGFGLSIANELLGPLTKLTDELIENAKQTNALKETALIAANSLKVFASGAIIVAASFKIAGDSLGKWLAHMQMLFEKADLNWTDLIFPAKGIQKLRSASQSVLESFREDSGDMASVIEGAVKMIDSIWDTTANNVNAKAGDNGAKLSAPIMLAADAAKKAAEAMREIIMTRFNDAMNQIAADNEIIKERIALMKEMDALGKRAAEGDPTISGDDGMFSGGRTRDIDEAIARFKELKELRLQLMTDAQREEEEHKARMERLAMFTDEELELLGGRNQIIEQMQAEHEEKLNAIRKKAMTEEQKIAAMSYRQRASTIAGEMANMTAAVAGHSKELFELNKIASIAHVALSLPEKISDAYKWGNKWGGPPLGAAMAAIAGAAGIAHLAAIKATSFGAGGGAAPSTAGTTAAEPVSPITGSGLQNETAPRKDIVFNIYGSTFNRDGILQIIEGMNEAFGEGARLRVNFQQS